MATQIKTDDVVQSLKEAEKDLKKVAATIEGTLPYDELKIQMENLLNGLERSGKTFLQMLMKCCAGRTLIAGNYSSNKYEVSDDGKEIVESQTSGEERHRYTAEALIKKDHYELAKVLCPLIEGARERISVILSFTKGFKQKRK